MNCPGCGEYCLPHAGRCEDCQANEMRLGPWELDQDRWA
jgi:uncharacterized OB-fold protein